MAKKNSFGKIIALTTTVAAIGGACYIFRDQIKESSLYKKTVDKLSGLRDKMSDHTVNEDDDFFFDDDFEDDFNDGFKDDLFSDDAKKNREYTSITINAKDVDTSDDYYNTEEVDDAIDDVTDQIADITDSTEEVADEVSDAAKEVADDIANAVKSKTEDVKEIFADVSIPTITFGSNNSDAKEEPSATEEILGYENEGLSDVAEDPDVLADMDKLDF